jgi:hypothetical protein
MEKKMRKNFPLLSQELNDKLLLCYENLTYLLGQKILTSLEYSGLYSQLENSCSELTLSSSGIPNVNNEKIIDILKFDYFYRTHFKQIKR